MLLDSCSILALVFIELLLGLDNILFIHLFSAKLDPKIRVLARNVGLVMACILRILFLFFINIIRHFVEPVFLSFSWRDMIFFFGGLFLIFENINTLLASHQPKTSTVGVSISKVIMKIIIFDVVCSLDSVMVAITLSDNIWLISLATMVTTGIIMGLSYLISDLMALNTRFRILAVGYIFLIAGFLICDAIHIAIDRSYLYAIMLFSVSMEVLYYQQKYLVTKK